MCQSLPGFALTSKDPPHIRKLSDAMAVANGSIHLRNPFAETVVSG